MIMLLSLYIVSVFPRSLAVDCDKYECIISHWRLADKPSDWSEHCVIIEPLTGVLGNIGTGAFIF